jgi:hypothetical protein
MAAWDILKELKLDFNEMSKGNLDKIVAGMSTEEIQGVLDDLEKAKNEAKQWNENLDLAFAIVKKALALVVTI